MFSSRRRATTPGRHIRAWPAPCNPLTNYTIAATAARKGTSVNRLVAFLVCIGMFTAAFARTYTLSPTQELVAPDLAYELFGMAVAIDGNSIIAIADGPGARVALLYRRGANGVWSFSRVLLENTEPPQYWRANVAMRNGIAAVQLSDTVVIFERVNNDWVLAPSAEPIRHPGGLAISGNRVLIGGNQCQYDAVSYQKRTDGVWTETGRLVYAGGGGCNNTGMDVELYYNDALVRRQSTPLVNAYRASGGSWSQLAGFLVPSQAAPSFGPLTLQRTTSVSPGSAIFHRGSGDAWNYTGQLEPVDYGNGSGHANKVKYRDGVLLTSEGWSETHQYTKVYAYHENADGTFSHIALLDTAGWTQDFDVSGNLVVAAAEDYGGARSIGIFTLPSPIVPPDSISNDFNAGDVSGFTTNAGSQFALAGNVYERLYRQSSTAGESIAVLDGSDWRNYQSIETDFTPTAFDGPDRYVGLAVRYQDAANNYYVTWRSSNVIQLKRKVNGAFVTLAERALPLALNTRHHLKLAVSGSHLAVRADGAPVLEATDTTFAQGSAALITYRARADFDNVYVAPTPDVTLNYNDWVDFWYGFGRAFTTVGGHWEITGENDPEGWSQTTTDGIALAYNGVPTDDMLIRSRIRLDSFAVPSGAWFGLVTRYVDERNYYFLSIRSSNVLQIRKVVDGVTTVLKSVSYTATPGEMHAYSFSAYGNQLHAFVDDRRVASAIDDALPRGKYGMGTYRTAATWRDYLVTQ